MATTFPDMREAVISWTKRPELIALTDAAIKLATLRAHHVDFFPRDQANVVKIYTLPVGNQLFVDITDIYTDAPLLRTPDWMQSEDTTTLLPTENLKFLSSYKEFWDVDQTLQTSVFTQMGETLRVSFAGASGRVRLFYYKNPDTGVESYSSWVANMHKDELAHWAAGIVWARSGFTDMAKQAYASVQDFKSLLVESYLTSKV